MASFDIPAALLAGSAAIFLLGAVVSMLPVASSMRRRTWALIAALAGSISAAIGAAGYWLQPMTLGRPLFVLAPPVKPFPGLTFDIYVDRLAAGFLLLTAGLAGLVAIYSLVWLNAEKPHPHIIAGIYNLFVLAALMVPIADNVYLFLVALESLTLTFGYLSLYRHDKLIESGEDRSRPGEMADAMRALKAYLIFSHVGVTIVMAALVLLAVEQRTLSFTAWRAAHDALKTEPGIASAVFVLALIGFSVKGGFFPWQSWVALVHPYSPTTTHALTLGFVIKVSSFYGLLRVAFQFLPTAQPWWGALVLVIAGLTALFGVFYAIASRDLKSALANHSVENFGIILAGIGVALAFAPSAGARPAAAAIASLGLTAALYHMLNHAIFKSLLYLCTGAIEHRAGTVEMERLGGLVKTLPSISAAFLVGALAIAGFPPLNGFASEWLTVQALLAGLSYRGTEALSVLRTAVLLAALLALALAFALTALAFVKITGETLLGAARDPAVARRLAQGSKHEAPLGMRSVLALLALLCLLLGILPGLAVNPLVGLASDLLASPAAWTTASPTLLSISIPDGASGYRARWDMWPAAILLIAPLGLALGFTRARRRSPPGPVWNCGSVYQPESMQITGGAFASLVLTPARIRAPDHEDAATGATAVGKPRDSLPWQLILSRGYRVQDLPRRVLNAGVRTLLHLAESFGAWFQGGDIRRYLAYLFIIFIVALLASLFIPPV